MDKLKVTRDGEVLVDIGPNTMAVTTRVRALQVVEARAKKRAFDALDALDMEVLVAAGELSGPERPCGRPKSMLMH